MAEVRLSRGGSDQTSYKILKAGTVGIVRILYERADVVRHLRED